MRIRFRSKSVNKFRGSVYQYISYRYFPLCERFSFSMNIQIARTYSPIHTCRSNGNFYQLRVIDINTADDITTVNELFFFLLKNFILYTSAFRRTTKRIDSKKKKTIYLGRTAMMVISTTTTNSVSLFLRERVSLESFMRSLLKIGLLTHIFARDGLCFWRAKQTRRHRFLNHD